MNEAQAQAIHNSQDLSAFSREELTECDNFVRQYALDNFNAHVDKLYLTKAMSDFLKQCVRIHYGSGETDELLMSLHCYPEWIK